MANIFDFESVDQFLLHELDARKRRNESYSLRAYARDLGLSASRLSEILAGKAGMSEKMALLIAEKMKLNPADKRFWLDLVLASTSRHQKIKSHAKKRLHDARKNSRLKEIKEAQFRAISDWAHAAILELMEIKGFQLEPDWIAKQLGISKSETIDTILRLKRLGLIVEKDGQWRPQPEAYYAFSESPSAAIQKFHRQILGKSMASLQDDAPADRQIQAMILAIPKKNLPLFGEKIKKFLNECWEDIDGAEKDDLYALAVQLVPVRCRSARET